MPFWNFCCYYFVFWLQPSASCKKWGLLLPFLQCNKILLKIMIIFHNIFLLFVLLPWIMVRNESSKWRWKKIFLGPFHCRTILSFSYEKMHFFQKSYFNIRNAFYWFNSWYHQPPLVVKERNFPTFLSKDIYIVFNKRFIKLFLASFGKVLLRHQNPSYFTLFIKFRYRF